MVQYFGMRFLSLKEAALLLSILVLVGILWHIASQDADPLPKRDEVIKNVEVIDTSSWHIYTNDTYQFTIAYPEPWAVDVSDDQLTPSITVYKPGEPGELGTLDHFANRTHVSIYPRGLPIEGVIGEQRPSSVTLAYQTNQAIDFVLTEHNPWATYITFVVTPDRWGPSGYIWASNRVTNLFTVCSRGGQTIPRTECDPLFGDTMTREGEVSEEDRQLIEVILGTFRFLEQAPSNSDKENAVSDIHVSTPQEGERVHSPLHIRGEARGTWFFEGNFKITLLDANGNEISQGIAIAQSDWMTAGMVPFYAEVTFEKPDTSVGMLVLQKANPTGLPAHEGEFRIEVAF